MRLRDLDDWLASVSGFLWASMFGGRLNHPRRDQICLIIAGYSHFPTEAKAAFYSLEQFSDNGAIGWDLHLHSAIAIKVDYRECLAGFVVEDILGDIEGSLETFGAEATAFTVDIIRMCTRGTMRRVAGECFHDIKLVIMG